MTLNKLTDQLAVAGQIEAADIPGLAEQGIKAIICNRPDGEAMDQPSFHEIEAAAADHGIKLVYLPVLSSSISEADVEAFGKALEELPKPVLAYCRSGTRSTVLWSLSQAGKRPVEEILQAALEAGYDMRPLLPRLQS
jgi:sulfide:quinone oxidoreductase